MDEQRPAQAPPAARSGSGAPLAGHPSPAAGVSCLAAPSQLPAQAPHWHKLDNTANLFPVITSDKFTNVFRLSFNLIRPVAPELLQQALEQVLPRFDAMRVRLRRGLFWHYLEDNPATPTVRLEDEAPCRAINPAQNDHFLFRVTYFAARVNLEVFHVLTDGSGALQFLQALVCRYLMLAHPAAFSAEDRARQWFCGHAANTEDSYVSNYTPTKKQNFRIGRGFHLRGERRPMNSLSVVHAHIGLPALLALCKQKGATVTQYLTAVIGWAVYTQQMAARPPRHPLNIFVPVNLRGLFESSTSLNFFSNIYITLAYDAPALTFDTLLAEVNAQFEEKVSREAMLEKISYTVGSGYSLLVRVVPLPLKNLALRLIFQASAKSSSMGFSNLGRAALPAQFVPYVAGASFMLSTTGQEPFKAAAISWGDTLTLTFTSTLKSMALQREMVRLLAGQGLAVTVESNGVDYASM